MLIYSLFGFFFLKYIGNSRVGVRVGEFLRDPKTTVWPDCNDFVPASSIPEGELAPRDGGGGAGTRHTAELQDLNLVNSHFLSRAVLSRVVCLPPPPSQDTHVCDGAWILEELYGTRISGNG